MFFLCLFLAVSGYLLWISWSLWPIALICFVTAVVGMTVYVFTLLKLCVSKARKNRWIAVLCFGFLLFSLSNLVGVFLPETGFDAVWYHLPITAVFTHLHQTIFIPELYQSAMPRLGSYLFVFPFLMQVIGVKMFCFFISLFIPILTYKICRIYLPSSASLFFALIIYSFHIVTWQASSAYVDLLRTMFELSALYYLLQKPLTKKILFFAGILVGLGVATKLIAIFFLPFWMLFVHLSLSQQHKKWVGIFLFSSCIPILPWLLQTTIWTGNPIFPLFQSSIGNQQIAEQGFQHVLGWIVHQSIRLLAIPYYLVTNAEGYTTPLFLFTLPFIASGIKRKIMPIPFFVFSILSLMLWFFIPPLSLRYAFTASIVFLLFGYVYTYIYTEKKVLMRRVFLLVGIFGILLNLFIRFGANYRDMKVIFGMYPVQNYIQDHSQGIQKGPMELWYGGYWNRYSRSK